MGDATARPARLSRVIGTLCRIDQGCTNMLGATEALQDLFIELSQSQETSYMWRGIDALCGRQEMSELDDSYPREALRHDWVVLREFLRSLVGF